MMKVVKIQFKNGLKKLLKLGSPTTENIPLNLIIGTVIKGVIWLDY